MSGSILLSFNIIFPSEYSSGLMAWLAIFLMLSSSGHRLLVALTAAVTSTYAEKGNRHDGHGTDDCLLIAQLADRLVLPAWEWIFVSKIKFIIIIFFSIKRQVTDSLSLYHLQLHQPTPRNGIDMTVVEFIVFALCTTCQSVTPRERRVNQKYSLVKLIS